MKKLMLIMLALSCASVNYASTVSYSSTTLTNDMQQTLRSTTSTNTVVQQLTAIIITSPTIGGVCKIFNSSYAVAAATVAIIGMNTVGYYPFYDIPLKGITYTTSGNTNGVIIIYKY